MVKIATSSIMCVISHRAVDLSPGLSSCCGIITQTKSSSSFQDACSSMPGACSANKIQDWPAQSTISSLQAFARLFIIPFRDKQFGDHADRAVLALRENNRALQILEGYQRDQIWAGMPGSEQQLLMCHSKQDWNATYKIKRSFTVAKVNFSWSEVLNEHSQMQCASGF